MAGTAQHLAAADRVISLLGEGSFKNIALFYSGNIAPDAIHARVNYVRAFKKHTHLTEGINNLDFIYPDKLAIFRERLDSYIKTYYHPADADSDLYLGYIAHLMTDELFNIHAWDVFAKRMAKDGVDHNDIEYFNRSMRDMDIIDGLVMESFPFARDVEALLSSVWGIGIKDMILPEEADASKRWVINKLFHTPLAERDTVYYKIDEALAFVNYASDEVARRIRILRGTEETE